MTGDILHWMMIGFFFGVGFGVSTWIVGKILR